MRTSDLDAERGAASLDEALADPGAAVAVVADPFAGRDAVLDGAAATLSDPARTTLDPDATDPPSLGDGPHVVDDCHHLHARHIGGFDPLDRFLDRLATAEGTVVTSWNRHAWAYLDAVRNITSAFGHVFRLPPLSADDLAATVRERCAVPSSFTADRPDPVRTVTYRLPTPRGGSVALSLPTVDTDYVAGLLVDRDPPDAETLVFRRLTRLADGNPGVAAALWDRAVEGDAVSPADIVRPADAAPDLTADAAHVLRLVVTKGRATCDDLAAAAPDVPLDRTLRTLVDGGFVDDADPVSLRPDGFPTAVERLRGRRLVW